MSEGFVYILTNAAMPGYVKIGMSGQDDLKVRLRQLDNTSTPLPFEVHYAARVPDCRKVERTLHFVFGEKRARSSREFFQIDPELARAVVELVAIQETAPTDAEQGIAPEQREEIEAEERSRSDRLTLGSLGLLPGTVLVFSKDPQVTCTVAGPKTVVFQGQEQSLSSAALKAIHAMGYAWPRVNGFEYWTTDGLKLNALTRGGAGEAEAEAEEPPL